MIAILLSEDIGAVLMISLAIAATIMLPVGFIIYKMIRFVTDNKSTRITSFLVIGLIIFYMIARIVLTTIANS